MGEQDHDADIAQKTLSEFAECDVKYLKAASGKSWSTYLSHQSQSGSSMLSLVS